MEWIEAVTDARLNNLLLGSEPYYKFNIDTNYEIDRYIYQFPEIKSLYLIFKIRCDVTIILKGIFLLLKYEKQFYVDEFIEQNRGKLLHFINHIQNLSNLIAKHPNICTTEIRNMKNELKTLFPDFINGDEFINNIIASYHARYFD